MQALIAQFGRAGRSATRSCRLSGTPAVSARTGGCFDPWMRVPERIGATVLNVAADHGHHRRLGGLNGHDLPRKRRLLVPWRTATVHIGRGKYWEPNVWMRRSCEHAMGGLDAAARRDVGRYVGDHLTGPLRFSCGQWPVAAGAQEVRQAPGVAARQRTFWPIGAGFLRRSEPVNSGSGTARLTTRSGLAGRSGLAANCGLVKRSGSDSAEWAAARLVKVPPNLCSAAESARKVPTAGSWGWSSAVPGWPARKRGACAGSYAAQTAAAQAPRWWSSSGTAPRLPQPR